MLGDRLGTARLALDRSAVVDSVPLLIPAIPFGFVLGLAMTESEMPLWIAALTSPLVFAGAAQLALVTIAGTASLWAVISAVLVINSRHVMYSVAMAPTFRHQPGVVRWLAPFVLIDQVFALTALQIDRPPDSFRRYYFTVGLMFFAFWNLAVPIGMIVGPVVPDGWRLDVAPAVMFCGLALFAASSRPAAVAALTGALASLLAVGLRDRLGIIVGATVGVVAGTIADRSSVDALRPTEEPA